MKPSPFVELLCAHPALIWSVDPELRFTSISGLGISAELARQGPLIGMSIQTVLPDGALENSALGAHRRASEGRSARFEFTFGENHWAGCAEPILGISGQIEGVSAAVFDQSDRVFSEKVLHLSEQSYRSLIEEAPFAIARATLSGQLLQVNRAMAEMLCFESEQELLICSLSSEIFAKSNSYQDFVSCLSSHDSLQGIESIWIRRDGKPISVSLAGRATRNEQGRISYFEILAENITERKQLESQLQQVHKLQAVGQLAAGIAHDFNNLLTIISGQVQMALSELPSGDPLQERLEDVEAAAGRATKLTRQLLAFGRLQNLETKVLSLNSVITGSMQMLVLLLGKTISLEFTSGQDLGFVKADPVQVEQILMNLVLNARDATPDGGRLKIFTENIYIDSSSPRDASVAPPGAYVTLSVIDNGHGMSPETMARIFEPFFTTKNWATAPGWV